MLRSLKKLYEVNLLSPKGIYHFASQLFTSGTNLMALLRYAAKMYAYKTAITDDYRKLTYADLLHQSEALAQLFMWKYNISARDKVAIMCRNHAFLVQAIFSVSAIGADIYLFNTEMSREQFAELCREHDFRMVIYDEHTATMVRQTAIPRQFQACHAPVESPFNGQIKQLRRARSGKIVVLTGGTTGKYKTAGREASVTHFLSPFMALLCELDLKPGMKVYAGTPIYHGYGAATLFMALMLGAELYLREKFVAAESCRLVKQEKIEVVTLVPLMLKKMMDDDSDVLRVPRCIVSGGAVLTPTLAQEVIDKAGAKLYNLYGTSEAGVSIMATPATLGHSVHSIGRKIPGVALRILDKQNRVLPHGNVGRICIKSSWATDRHWIETGDVGYTDSEGYFYLCGRVDDMIISGGENVYPLELENILSHHPSISQVAVIGIDDDLFGQRLKAFVVPGRNCIIRKDDIFTWLSTRAARYQMPKQIEVLAYLPHTPLGKPDKKLLR